MSQLEKPIARLCSRPPDMDFNDVAALLEHFGYVRKDGKGSHVAFRKEGERTITVPTIGGRKVKRTYLTQIRDALGLDC
jgi:predicted RNA binding protein YcfA (HicA-like mRNA interferase family)